MMKRAFRMCSGLLAAATASACSDSLGPGALSVPAETAYIQGVITARQSDRVLVEGASPRPEHPVDKAWVTVTTALLREPGGGAAQLRDLVPGRAVRVWVTGAELRSYPVQVSAVFVAIDR